MMRNDSVCAWSKIVLWLKQIAQFNLAVKDNEID